MNKRGAELSMTVVWLILAVVVLVLFVFLIIDSGGNFINNILGLGGGKETVSTVVSRCNLLCASGGTDEYCGDLKKVIYEDKGDIYWLTCSMIDNLAPDSIDVVNPDSTTGGKIIKIPETSLVCDENINRGKCEDLTNQAKSRKQFLDAMMEIKKGVTDKPAEPALTP